jgi:hypothetical protein
MHFSFNLLRIKGLYMFRALVAHPQEALHKRHLVYWLRINISWLWHSCSETATVPQPTLYARNIPSAVCAAPTEDEQVMLETCTGPWSSINWMKSISRWFHYTDILTRHYRLFVFLHTSNQTQLKRRYVLLSDNPLFLLLKHKVTVHLTYLTLVKR